jgi:hypothetical protein
VRAVLGLTHQRHLSRQLHKHHHGRSAEVKACTGRRVHVLERELGGAGRVRRHWLCKMVTCADATAGMMGPCRDGDEHISRANEQQAALQHKVVTQMLHACPHACSRLRSPSAYTCKPMNSLQTSTRMTVPHAQRPVSACDCL